MSLYNQSIGILKARNELDDMYWSKTVFRFSPLQGPQDGTNLVFAIPQQRIVNWNAATWATSGSVGTYNIFPQVYKNNAPLVFGTDYVLTDYLNGIITFASAKTPGPGDVIDCTFNYLWMTDVDLDNHLDHSASEVGFGAYFTAVDLNDPNITSTNPVTANIPPDIPDALFSAIIMLGASFASRALSLRFATRYDTSAGDQSFSPSQMSEHFATLADSLEKQGYTARDDFYKGQSRQYAPALGVNSSGTVGQGYILPNWTPSR